MINIVFLVILGWFMTGCGGSSSSPSVKILPLQKGYVLDSPIAGLDYECGDIKSVTNDEGMFECREFPVTFKIGNLIIGTVAKMTADKKIYPQDIIGKPRSDFEDAKVVALTRFLQSLDDDGDIEKVIKITPKAKETFDTEQELSELGESDAKALVADAGKTYVAKEAAMQHLKDNVEKLTSIMITPSTTTIAQGESVTFKADGSFSNGVTRDISSEGTWSSSDSAVASLDGAKAEAQSIGTTTIMIRHKGISKTATLTVTAATLSTLDINATDTTLAEGTQTQLSVTGTYSDSTTSIMTSQVSWNSSDSSKATVDANGLVTAVATGSATISATKDGVSEAQVIMITDATLTGIALEPIADIAKGLTGQLAVIGTYTNGQTQTLTSGVDFNASDVSVATVTSSGLVTAVKEGTTTIMIRSGELVSQADVTVLPAVISSIMIDPASATLAKGETLQLKATGTYSDSLTKDLTSEVTWGGFDTAFVSVDGNGLLTALAAGTTQIEATSDSQTASLNVTVIPAILTNIAIEDIGADSLAKGATKNLKVKGTYSDGTSADITSQTTWSANNSFVSVNNSGLMTASAVGSSIVTATVGGQTAQITITVTAATLVGIDIASISDIEKGATEQLVATGTYTDSTTKDISSEVTWSTSDATKATVDGTGLVSALQEGTISIIAGLNGITTEQSLTILPPVLTAVTLAPTTAIELLINNTAQLTVTGAYSDGSTKDISSAMTWTSSSDILSVSSDGFVSGFGIGTATVTGTLGDKSVSKQVTVSGISYTEVSGQIREDTSWTLDNSPYKITDTIQIAEGVTLTVDPGVRVYGDGNMLEVFGTLYVAGSDIEKVILSNIDIRNAESVINSKIDIHFADIRSVQTGQEFASDNGIVNIFDSKVQDIYFTASLGNQFLYIAGNGYREVHLERNVFINSPNIKIYNFNFFEASGTENSIVIIKNNLFYNSGSIISAGSTLSSGQAASKIIDVNYNSFIQSIGVKLEDSGKMNAQNNYWGTTDETEISSMIWDNYDDLALNEVSFKPYLTEPHPDTPTYDPASENDETLASQFDISQTSFSGVSFNGVIQQNSKISFSILSRADKSYFINKMTVVDANGKELGSTTDASLLNNNYIYPNKSIGLTLTVGYGGAVLPFTVTYELEEIETGKEFKVIETFQQVVSDFSLLE